MTIIIDNIITPYEIARYNEINKVLKGEFEVWFQRESEANRLWNYFPMIKFKYKILRQNFEVMTLLKKYHDKLKRVICCGWNSFPYWYTLFFCKKHNIRFTLWSGTTKFENRFFHKIFLLLIKYFVKNTDDFIAYGSRARDYLVSLGVDKKRIKTFLNSVDIDYFLQRSIKLRKKRKNLSKKYGIDKNTTVLVYVGQLIKRKGVRELLDAFRTISLSYHQVMLLIVGAGPEAGYITSFINLHKELKIKLIGYVEYNRLPEIYTVSDVLVLPSKEEVWGLVVNEALASGIPVLVSRFAGCLDDLLNGDNGEIIGEITPKRITEAFTSFFKKKHYFISPQLLKKMNNKTYVRQVFYD